MSQMLSRKTIRENQETVLERSGLAGEGGVESKSVGTLDVDPLNNDPY